MTLNIYNPVKRKELSLNLLSFIFLAVLPNSKVVDAFFFLSFFFCRLTIRLSVTLSLYHPEKMFGAEDYTEKAMEFMGYGCAEFFVLFAAAKTAM